MSIIDGFLTWPMVEIPNGHCWVSARDLIFRDDFLEWMAENIGAKQTMRNYDGMWRNTVPLTVDTTVFYFRDPDHAIMFKLRWA